MHTYQYHTAPTLTVVVSNTANAVAGTRHTLSCSVTGANLQGATVSYVWQLNGVDIQGAASPTYDITSVQVTDAGNVYTCQVTVMASYWDVSGSFGGSGSGTLMVSSKSSFVFTCTVIGPAVMSTMSLQLTIPRSKSVNSHWELFMLVGLLHGSVMLKFLAAK